MLHTMAGGTLCVENDHRLMVKQGVGWNLLTTNSERLCHTRAVGTLLVTNNRRLFVTRVAGNHLPRITADYSAHGGDVDPSCDE